MSRYGSALSATLAGITNRWSTARRLEGLAPEHRVEGQTWLVTGATSGLGLAIATQLAERGAHVVMAGRRHPPEAEAAVAGAGGPPPRHLALDLSRLASARAAAASLAADGVRLDGVVLNAGMVAQRSRVTADGVDEMTQVNFLGHYLLMQELLRLGVLPRDRAPAARVVVVSSESHRSAAPLEPDPLTLERRYGPGQSVAEYGRTKLMVTTFAQALARRLDGPEGPQVAVHALCPGAVDTNIAREAPGWTQPILRGVFRLFFRAPAAAAEPALYLACHPALAARTGVYLHLMQEKAPSDLALDHAAQDALWSAASRVVGAG